MKSVIDETEAIGGDETQFRTGVVNGIKTLAEQNEELTSNLDRLDKSTQKAIEELGAITKVTGEFEKKFLAVNKLEAAYKRERQSAWGSQDGVARILNDPDMYERAAKMIDGLRYRRPVVRAVGEDTSPGSTYILDKDISQEIYDTLLSYGQFTQLGLRPVTTKITKFPVKTARALATWITTEAATIPQDGTKAGTSVDCQVRPAAVLLNVSKQLIADSETSGVDIVPDVLAEFVQAVYNAIDTAAFVGNGTLDATNGGYTGLFGFCTQTVSAVGQMTMETTTVDTFIKQLTAVDPVVLSRKPKWFIHPTMLARSMSIKDTTGRPIFLSQNDAPSLGGIGSILGFPVVLVSAAPSTNALSQKFAAFADPNTIVVGLRNDFEMEWSDIPAFAQYQRAFRGIARAGVIGRRATGGSVMVSSAT